MEEAWHHLLSVPVDIHRPITAACFSSIPGARLPAVRRRAMDVISVVYRVRATAPALDAVLDTKVGRSGTVHLTGLREGSTAVSSQDLSQRTPGKVRHEKERRCRLM